MSSEPRQPAEAKEIMSQGLRILARLIARAHLEKLAEEAETERAAAKDGASLKETNGEGHEPGVHGRKDRERGNREAA